MTGEWTKVALITLAPATALLAAYPRRPAGAWAMTAVSVAGAAAAIGGFDAAQRHLALVIAVWSAAGALYAVALSMRERREVSHVWEKVAQLKDRRKAIAAEVAEARAEGERVQRAHKEASSLYALTKGISAALSWDEIKPRLETAVDQYLGVSGFALYAAGMRGDGRFEPLTTRGLENSPGASWVTLERCLQERGLSPWQGHILDKPERAVCVPVLENAELLGIFYVKCGGEARQAPELLAKVGDFALELAFAFRRVKLFQEMERLSQIDGLTGVHRRGALDERLRDEVVRGRTFKTTFCVMLLDIDHFKSLNDRYGHPFGDQVLRRIGEILNHSFYETDFVARYGGEEFAVIMPRAQFEGARRKAEAVRTAIESESFLIALETIRVTVSIGLAHFPRDAGGPEELVSQADQALYQAKSQGRNRVVEFAR